MECGGQRKRSSGGSVRESTEPVRHGIGAEIKQTGYFRLEALLLGAMLSALGGGTDAAEICGAINGKFREEIFEREFPDFTPRGDISPDLMRKAMMLAGSGKLPDLCLRLTAGFVRKVIRSHPLGTDYVSMNSLWIRESPSVPGRGFLLEKGNEDYGFKDVSDPGVIRMLDVRGGVVAVPLSSAPPGLAGEVLAQGGQYLFTVPAGSRPLEEEAGHVFVTHCGDVLSSAVHADTGDVKKKKVTVSMLPASLLPQFVTAYYDGLEGGSIVRVDMSGIRDSRKITSAWCITSMAPVRGNLARIAEAAAPCLLQEEELHWLADLRFGDERMRPDDPVYLANRQALSGTAESLLRYWSIVRWEERLCDKPMSISAARELARQPIKAMRCLCSLGSHSIA